MNSKSDNPLVSIIVITYNSAEYVMDTLESAKAQTYENIELIITDDSSSDATIDLCRRWMEGNSARFSRTQLITVEKNTGIPANCNRGVRAAKGEWIKFIAGDDQLTGDCIEKLLHFSLKNKEVQIVAGKMENFNVNQEIIEVTPSSKDLLFFNWDAGAQYKFLLKRSFNFAPATFMKKQLIEKLGYFDENYKYFEDLPMWLKICKSGTKFHFLNEIVVKYRVGENSMINNSTTMFNLSFIKSYFDFRRENIYKNVPYYDIIFWQSEMIELIHYKVMVTFFKNRKSKNALRFRSFIYLFSSKRYWYFLKNRLRNE